MDSRRASALAFVCFLFGCAVVQPTDFRPIGTIDFYGLRTISETEVREFLPFKEGDTPSPNLPESLSSEVAASLGVARVRFGFVCCSESGLSLVYIGVEETPGPSMAYREAPSGDSTLPREIVASYDELMDAYIEAVLSGNAGEEDSSEGHSLTDNPPIRAIQERFLIYAEQDRGILLQVLHESANADNRAAAAWVLGYAQDKASITGDLTQAILDPDGGVRNNATRALAVIGLSRTPTPRF